MIKKDADSITANPMFRPDGHVDLPTIHAEAYDVNLPYSATFKHIRDIKSAEEKRGTVIPDIKK